MAFSLPSRHQRQFDPEILVILIGLFLLLLSMLLVAFQETAPRERLVPKPEVAKVALAQGEQPAGTPGVVNTGTAANAVITATVKAGPLEVALRDLLKGPSAAEIKAGQYSEIPKGTQLLGVSVQDETVTVNLSDEFASGGGSTSMIERVNELKNTVTGVNRNYQVKIAINGKLVEYLGGEGLEVN